MPAACAASTSCMLSPRQTGATDDNRKKAVQRKPTENSLCCDDRLVGRNCQAKMCVQSIEGLDDSGIATSQPQGVRFVDLEKARNPSAFLLEISAHGDQRALHQLRHAVANHILTSSASIERKPAAFRATLSAARRSSA